MVKNKRGFTLIEVLLALLMLGLFFIPVSHGVVLSVKINAQSHQRITAMRGQQAQLEEAMVLLEADEPIQIHQQVFHHTPFIQLSSTSSDMDDDNLTVNVPTLRVLQLPGEKPWNTPRYYPLPEGDAYEE
ncbi:prepilin-type N-terminal cleavage/methylation domain-containing protein [Anoxynatronum sibiricum]|uniref:Prepilin-type N-terminal cleavage/methylation domain-containing protein n=1 Tax=Anoxynatronum sibiricum TaxID=210623 RepID=A0ABU9VQG7_9CLOT